jgi:hypothetical protein
MPPVDIREELVRIGELVRAIEIYIHVFGPLSSFWIESSGKVVIFSREQDICMLATLRPQRWLLPPACSSPSADVSCIKFMFFWISDIVLDLLFSDLNES